MEKFIPYEKLSKKEKRKLDQVKRQTWGSLNPTRRKPTNSRAYNRREMQRWRQNQSGTAFSVQGGIIVNNHEAIIKMTPSQMEQFLDQVYLAGLNTGMYAATHNDDSVLDANPFDETWLGAPAEDATAIGFDETGDEYMLTALVEAILRTAGLSSPEEN